MEEKEALTKTLLKLIKVTNERLDIANDRLAISNRNVRILQVVSLIQGAAILSIAILFLSSW